MRVEAFATPALPPAPPTLVPTAPPAATVPFDAVANLAHVRAAGVRVEARTLPRGVAWDISRAAPDVSVRHHDDPRLALGGDPGSERLLWETLRAEAYLAAVRDCGLVVVPWRLRDGARCAMISGEAMSGDRDFGAGTLRLLDHPDGRADRDCREGLVFIVLAAELGLDPDDPAFNEQAAARLRASRVQAHEGRQA